MKKLVTLVVSFNLLLIGNCFGQIESETDKIAVKNLIIKSFDEIFSNRNKERINKFYTEDFILLENGIIWNKDSIASNLDKMNSEITEKKVVFNRVNKFDFIEVKIKENIAWIAYHNNAVYNNGEGKIYGEDMWLESAVAIRTDEGWKIQLLHSTHTK